MVILLFAGFVSAVLLNIDKFESFKAGQLEAKVKEAKEVIDKATATIEQLESVTIPLLNSSLSILIYDGVFDGMDPGDKEKTLLELMKIEKVINVDSEYTNEVLTRAKNSVANHYFYEINSHITDNVREDFQNHFGRRDRIDHEPFKIEEVESFFSTRSHLIDTELSSKIEKYKQIMQDLY
ncbi:hypothetical protein M3E13_19505 [Oceanobacillus kimchii]|uniref:hypothetical protein n=1 Tax=Oceanobacillus kimchii TaxID=746691 RepID=UPI0021A43410|nr:hypothetical protein [Oceanobacillus kimchii]MCT1575708.1 hypothetical protein [Oceanobacillus kimchii]MCT2138087.1 hypothetical protein [Oceanobacillus kimchii]